MGDNIRKEVPYFPDFDIREAIFLAEKDATKGYMSITMQTYIRIKDEYGKWRMNLVVSSCQSANFEITDVKKMWDFKNENTKRFMKNVYLFQTFGIVNDNLYPAHNPVYPNPTHPDGGEMFPVDPIQEEEEHRVGKEFILNYELPEMEKVTYWDCEDIAEFIKDNGAVTTHPDGSETLFLPFPITVHKDGSITSQHRVID